MTTTATPTPPAADSHSLRNIEVHQIDPSPYQVRGAEDAELEELAESMARHGLYQPVSVREKDDGRFELIAGHRRHAAALQLLWTTIPSFITERTDQEAAAGILEENLQRKDLTATERARALQRYITEFDVTQAECGQRFGMAQETVANYLRLLEAPDVLVKAIDQGKLGIAQAKALLAFGDAEEVAEATKRALPSRWSGASTVEEINEERKWREQDERRKAERKETNAKEKEKASKAVDRLTKQLTKDLTQEGGIWRDEKGNQVLVEPVQLDGKKHTIKPGFTNPRYDPKGDPDLMREIEALGMTWDYSPETHDRPAVREHGFTRYTPSAKVREHYGVKGSAKCPCGGEHVIVRSLPTKDMWPNDTNQSGKVSQERYCADPKAVVLAWAKRERKLFEEQAALRQQDEDAIDHFLINVAPQGGAPMAALIAAALTLTGRGEADAADSFDLFKLFDHYEMWGYVAPPQEVVHGRIEQAVNAPGLTWTRIARAMIDFIGCNDELFEPDQRPEPGTVKALLERCAAEFKS